VIGLIGGVVLYFVVKSPDNGFWFTFLGMIMWGLGGLFIACIPNMIIGLILDKKTSFEHAKECNAVRKIFPIDFFQGD
jgi:hypothetical protein